MSVSRSTCHRALLFSLCLWQPHARRAREEINHRAINNRYFSPNVYRVRFKCLVKTNLRPRFVCRYIAVFIYICVSEFTWDTLLQVYICRTVIRYFTTLISLILSVIHQVSQYLRGIINNFIQSFPHAGARLYEIPTVLNNPRAELRSSNIRD